MLISQASSERIQDNETAQDKQDNHFYRNRSHAKIQINTPNLPYQRTKQQYWCAPLLSRFVHKRTTVTCIDKWKDVICLLQLADMFTYQTIIIDQGT